jgi:DNA repair protein RecO (recombination protein O)
MPVHTSEALILRTYKLGEADRIVVFLTRDHGKKRGVAKGARRPRSRYLGALEPLTRGEVAYYEREGRELVRLNYVDVVRSPLAAASAESLGHVGYFAELIDEWSPEAHADERLYRLGASVADALTDGTPVDALARYFEYWLLRLQGVYPALACTSCGGSVEAGATMPAREDGLCCRGCVPAGGTRLSPEAVRFLRTAGRVPPDRLAEVVPGAAALRDLEGLHRRLFAAHLEKDLKSARVLREMRHAR